LIGVGNHPSDEVEAIYLAIEDLNKQLMKKLIKHKDKKF
jgi:ribosome-associated translation inhibitor RaiA